MDLRFQTMMNRILEQIAVSSGRADWILNGVMEGRLHALTIGQIPPRF